MMLEGINRILLSESVSINSVNDAIDTHTRIIINYHTKGEDIATGARIIEVYAYGLTKAGNPVIRAFQPYGDTTSRVPSWKFFRLDRISYWKPTKQVFTEPASNYYQGLGDFNPDGDNTMSVVYKIAKFGNGNDNNEITKPINHSSPRMKGQSNTNNQQMQNARNNSNDVFKTDTEKRMERLKQQLNNPIKLSDIKTKQGFRQYNTNNSVKTQSGPRQKSEPTSSDKTNNAQSNQQPEPISIRDLQNMLAKRNQNLNNQTNSNNDLYKTDTERRMDRLRQQLDNPLKIDLSKMPRR